MTATKNSRPAAGADGAHAAPRTSRKPERPEAVVTVRLFDADRTDEELELDDALKRRLGDRQLLWIDIEGDFGADAAATIAARMKLTPATRRALENQASGPHLALHGPYIHVRVATEPDHDPSESARWVDLLAAANIVVSSHPQPIEFIRDLDDRIEADAAIGSIDAAAFVASMLDATVTSYFKAVDAIEDDVDVLDRRALDPRSGEDVLADLVALRRRIARLRRALSSEREVFAAFRSADFGVVAPGDDDTAFRALADRFESALQSVEDSRDLLLGSFDVFMTRTAQRTNEVMKVLALATVLLLPGSLIAGLLGMNVAVPLPKDDVTSFWLVVAAIVVLAIGVVLLARARRWI